MLISQFRLPNWRHSVSKLHANRDKSIKTTSYGKYIFAEICKSQVSENRDLGNPRISVSDKNLGGHAPIKETALVQARPVPRGPAPSPPSCGVRRIRGECLGRCGVDVDAALRPLRPTESSGCVGGRASALQSGRGALGRAGRARAPRDPNPACFYLAQGRKDPVINSRTGTT